MIPAPTHSLTQPHISLPSIATPVKVYPARYCLPNRMQLPFSVLIHLRGSPFPFQEVWAQCRSSGKSRKWPLTATPDWPLATCFFKRVLFQILGNRISQSSYYKRLVVVFPLYSAMQTARVAFSNILSLMYTHTVPDKWINSRIFSHQPISLRINFCIKFIFRTILQHFTTVKNGWKVTWTFSLLSEEEYGVESTEAEKAVVQRFPSSCVHLALKTGICWLLLLLADPSCAQGSGRADGWKLESHTLLWWRTTRTSCTRDQQNPFSGNSHSLIIKTHFCSSSPVTKGK